MRYTTNLALQIDMEVLIWMEAADTVGRGSGIASG